MQIGIDYSLTCPCICFLNGKQIFFRFLTSAQKYAHKFVKDDITIQGIEHPEYNHPLERYNNIARLIVGDTDYEITKIKKATNINIEDYSMGSKGRVFHIAENTAILKNYLWERNIEYKTVPPTVVKKFAFGKGNAKKEMMYEAWIKDVGLDLKILLDNDSDKIGSPIGDIVDSYFLAKMG